MSRLSFEEATAMVSSATHLVHASKDINTWDFYEDLAPKGYPPSTDRLYVGKDRKTGIKQVWPVDRLDLEKWGDPQNYYRDLNRQFSKFLIQLGRAINSCKAERSRLILPRHYKNKGSIGASIRNLEKGDHDH